MTMFLHLAPKVIGWAAPTDLRLGGGLCYLSPSWCNSHLQLALTGAKGS